MHIQPQLNIDPMACSILYIGTPKKIQTKQSSQTKMKRIAYNDLLLFNNNMRVYLKVSLLSIEQNQLTKATFKPPHKA